jgi:hypothetical protein
MVAMSRSISGTREEKAVEADQVEDMLCAGWVVREKEPTAAKAPKAFDNPKAI